VKNIIKKFREYAKEGFQVVQEDAERWEYKDEITNEQGEYIKLTILLQKKLEG
jgi:hypothetical protein